AHVKVTRRQRIDGKLHQGDCVREVIVGFIETLTQSGCAFLFAKFGQLVGLRVASNFSQVVTENFSEWLVEPVRVRRYCFVTLTLTLSLSLTLSSAICTAVGTAVGTAICTASAGSRLFVTLLRVITRLL